MLHLFSMRRALDNSLLPKLDMQPQSGRVEESKLSADGSEQSAQQTQQQPGKQRRAAMHGQRQYHTLALAGQHNIAVPISRNITHYH